MSAMSGTPKCLGQVRVGKVGQQSRLQDTARDDLSPVEKLWRDRVDWSIQNERCDMTAFNTVRFRVKPGRDQEFLDAHKKVQANWPGLMHANMIKTGERTYCIIAEWSDMDALAAARTQMIATLDSFRDTLEDLGGGLGVTDPVSGPVVLALK